MSYIVNGNTGKWELVIGLEVHCQVVSNAKLFSGSSAVFGGEPNTQVSFIDCGYPGVLPSLNMFCIKQAVKTGLALNGTINKISQFDRKHYFYPDLPLGYQITQFFKPIMEEGYLIISLKDGLTKSIGIERLHVEQDAGKLLHEHHLTKSFVDLNRAGVALMEIVSKPDLSSPLEVSEYLNKLRTIVRYIESCDGNMEEGSMRCDINISVRKVGETEKRTRVEVKNVNSIKFIMEAIEYEAQRQVEVWEEGKEVKQETRLFDSSKKMTFPLRSKEEANDYRYIKDPDLLPLEISDSYIEEIRESLPELPDKKKERFTNDYSLNNYDADVLTREKEIANYFEEAVNSKYDIRNPSLISNWILGNLFANLKKENLIILESKISSTNLASLVSLIEKEVISSKIAKDVFEIMWQQNNNTPAEDVVKEKGLEQVTNEKDIEDLIDKIIEENQDKVLEIKAGKDKLFGWFVGQVMKESQGKANPDIVNNMLKKKLQ